MSYKFTTGSVRRGDIYYEDDRLGDATYIDFGPDTIALRPSGSAILYAASSSVGIGRGDWSDAISGPGSPPAVLTVSGSDIGGYPLTTPLFAVRSDSYMDLLVVTGSGKVGINAPDPKIALDVHMDPTGLANDTGGGTVVKFGGGTVAKGKLYYLHTDQNWTATDSSAVATGADQMLAISLGTDPAVDGMLIRGFFDATSELTGFSPGKAVYVSETASKMDTAAPTTSAAFVRVVGWCTIEADVIYFNPSGDWVELA